MNNTKNGETHSTPTTEAGTHGQRDPFEISPEEPDLIHVYTRAEAIADGVLVDVSKTGREAGFKFPIALTNSVWADVNDIPHSEQGTQDADGRLWNLLHMAALSCKSASNKDKTPDGAILFTLIMHTSLSTYYRAKIHFGPGDDEAPVLTVLRPHED